MALPDAKCNHGEAVLVDAGQLAGHRIHSSRRACVREFGSPYRLRKGESGFRVRGGIGVSVGDRQFGAEIRLSSVPM